MVTFFCARSLGFETSKAKKRQKVGLEVQLTSFLGICCCLTLYRIRKRRPPSLILFLDSSLACSKEWFNSSTTVYALYTCGQTGVLSLRRETRKSTGCAESSDTPKTSFYKRQHVKKLHEIQNKRHVSPTRNDVLLLVGWASSLRKIHREADRTCCLCVRVVLVGFVPCFHKSSLQGLGICKK